MPGGKSQARTKKPTKAGKSGARAARPAKLAMPKAIGKAAKPKTAAKSVASKAPAKPKAGGSRPAAPARSGPAAKPAKTAARTQPTTAKRPGAATRPSAKPLPAKPTAARPRPAAVGASPVDHLHQVALVATDLGAAIAFYGDVLGLPFIARFDPPGLAFFDLGGGVRLMLSATASSATLYFHVKNVDAAFKALSNRGVRFLHKPSLIHRDDEGLLGKRGVGEWMAFFKDPSENLLALVERR